MNTTRQDLVALIDETLLEIEELKKSKFAAAEIKIEGPGESNLDGKPVNGSIETKKAEDEDEEEKEVEKKEDDKEEEKEKKEDEKKDKKIAQKEVDKHNEKKHGEDKDEDSAFKSEKVEYETLMKSYVEQRLAPIEEKLSTMIDVITKMANMPVQRKGIPVNVQALKKSDDTKTLSKTDIVNKLFELKKSGQFVDSLDFAKMDTGSYTDLQQIAEKYKLI